ncbi:MAG: coproporphyrinogen III oxidase [Nannocystaceae bacterium]|nr:coproporphyrinogen III oxidase [bacterium]
MQRTQAAEPRAGRALELVTRLQTRFADGLGALPGAKTYESVTWLRDEGRHGGGERLVSPVCEAFNRASVNVSQVHYDDLPSRRLSSATALSTIVHPSNPRAPSVHIHISWTAMRDGKAYWRLMADLNPSILDDADRDAYEAVLRRAAGEHYDLAKDNADAYFYIPALARHRGVAHVYLEGYDSGDFDDDLAFASAFGDTVTDGYVALLEPALGREFTEHDVAAQRAYHTAYLFQVLTLDRGTTSGLLIHDQNDVGILGSLPAVVDATLLRSWAEHVPDVQVPLVHGLAEALGGEPLAAVDEPRKRALAKVVREHYRANPEALSKQATGPIIPTTVANHGPR